MHDDDHPVHDVRVVVIGASAGGVTALKRVLGELPADFPLPVLVVQHLDPNRRTLLPTVLRRLSTLPVVLATDGSRAEPGTVHIAPPDRHLLVRPGRRLVLSDGERVHFSRPAVDRLFESAAKAYGPGVLACVLTGAGNDAAAGAVAVKTRGGTVLVEDPELAEFTGMPHAVVTAAPVDQILPLGEVAGAIMRRVERVGHGGIGQQRH